MNKQFDVVGIGTCAIDYIGVIDGTWIRGSKNRLKKFLRQGGGLIGTALVTLRRLGSKTAYLGKLGFGEWSVSAIDDLEADGVDVSHIIREEGASPAVAFILAETEKGERTIWWNDDYVVTLKPAEIKEEVIIASRYLHLDDYQLETALAAAAVARNNKVRVVLDLEVLDCKEVIPLIEKGDVVIVPEEFALNFAGCKEVEIAGEMLHRYGPGIVVITQGVRGSWVKTGTTAFHQPIFSVEEVDTTGCGDVFHGAFIYGLLQDWSIEMVAEFAAAAGAFACCAVGGRAGAPSLRQMKDFLNERGSATLIQALSEA